MTYYLSALLIGALSAAGFAPFSLPPVLIGAWAWLFHRLAQSATTRKQAFWSAYLFGFGQLAAGLYWIGESTLIDFATWGWAWPITTFGLPIGLGLYYGIAGYLTVRLPVHRVIAAAIFFGLEEMARAFLFTGFPWNLAGTTWISMPYVAQNADWMGVYGLTCVTLLLAALCAVPSETRRIGIAILILAAMNGYGLQVRQPTKLDDSVFVRIVQPNIRQGDKWLDDRVFSNSLLPLEMTATPPEDMNAQEHWIIWPETAQASPIWKGEQFMKFYRGALAAWPEGTTVYTGLLSLEKDNFANSVIAADRDGKILWSQNKHHLVPFGEYMPLDEYLHLGPIVGIDGFKPGTPPRSMAGGIIPLICYEIIFPELARGARAQDSRAIITVTDDSWFGSWSGPRQHMVQVRFRAIESGLPVLRSANTGISAIIDPYGRVVAQSKMNESIILDGYLPRKNKTTLYARMGDLITFLYFGIGAILLLLDKRQKLFR